MWILFEPYLSGRASSPPGTADVAGFAKSTGDSLRIAKTKLHMHAQQLLASEEALGEDEKAALRKLFNSSLDENPEKREMGALEEFVGRLDLQR